MRTAWKRQGTDQQYEVTMSDIEVERRGEVEWIRLNRPDRMNAYDGEMAQALGHLKGIAVLDRSSSFGAMDNAGPLFLETVAALAVHGQGVPVMGYVYGLGGREILPHEIEAVYHELQHATETGQTTHRVRYLGVRE